MDKLQLYITTILFIIMIMALWALIQYLWLQVFEKETKEKDALAARGNCSNCQCTTSCKLSKNKKHQISKS